MDAWAALLESYSAYLLSSGRSLNTVRTYGSNLKNFWVWCMEHETEPAEVHPTAIRYWLASRVRTHGTKRAHNELAAVRAYFTSLILDGLRMDNPTEGLAIKRAKTLPTMPLSISDVAALVGACDNLRDALLVRWCVYTGMRLSEVAALRTQDIDWAGGAVKVHGKGNKERRVPLAPDLLHDVRKLQGVVHGPVWLSQQNRAPLTGHQIRKILYRLAAKAGLADVHPHRLRATFATEYMKCFNDIEALQAIMGHESIETTALYTQSDKQRRGTLHMQDFRLGV